MSESNDSYIGLISGTSLDAVDAVRVCFSNQGKQLTARLTAQSSHPIPAPLRQALLDLSQNPDSTSLRQYGELDTQVGNLFAEAASSVMTGAEQIVAIGSHGQTIFHAPDGSFPHTLQIGDPNIIAARTGITTIADFRRRDIAEGGQAAPLAPAFHAGLFSAPGETRFVINLGGIANLTYLPADGGAAIGYDSGPANCLMDAWCMKHRNLAYDRNGEWAMTGQIDHALLRKLLADDYLQLPFPKSTGRDHYNLHWLAGRLADSNLAPQDVQRTLLELTASTTADAVLAHATQEDQTAPVILCGGGAHNQALRARLQDLLDAGTYRVTDTDEFGIGPDWVEAAAFAWLAMRRLQGLPGNLPSVTGASRAAVLGAIYSP